MVYRAAVWQAQRSVCSLLCTSFQQLTICDRHIISALFIRTCFNQASQILRDNYVFQKHCIFVRFLYMLLVIQLPATQSLTRN